jgi:hypothetical protein
MGNGIELISEEDMRGDIRNFAYAFMDVFSQLGTPVGEDLPELELTEEDFAEISPSEDDIIEVELDAEDLAEAAPA